MLLNYAIFLAPGNAVFKAFLVNSFEDSIS